jgi:hypothetical protein
MVYRVNSHVNFTEHCLKYAATKPYLLYDTANANNPTGLRRTRWALRCRRLPRYLRFAARERNPETPKLGALSVLGNATWHGIAGHSGWPFAQNEKLYYVHA